MESSDGCQTRPPQGGRGWRMACRGLQQGGKHVDGGLETCGSSVLKRLCFQFTAKLWTSHSVLRGLKMREGQERFYLRALLVWAFSGSNLNRNPEQPQRLVSNTFHTQTLPESTLCRHEGTCGPPLPLLAPPSSAWAPARTLPRYLISPLPRDPHQDPSRRHFWESALRNSNSQLCIPLHGGQNHVKFIIKF